MMKKIWLGLLFVLSFSVGVSATWESIGPNGGADVVKIIANPNRAGTLYAGMGSPNGINFEDGGVFKSVDNGQSWVPTGLLKKDVRSLAIDAAGNLYAGVAKEKNIYKSTDDGKTWTRLELPTSGAPISSLAIDKKGNIYAAEGGSGRNYFWKSADGGKNWTPASGLEDVLTIFIDKLNTLYVGTRSSVDKSIDEGETWIRGPYLTYVSSLATDSADNLYAGASDNIYKSPDGGQSWSSMALPNKSISSLAIDRSDSIYAGTYRNGIYKSINGGKAFTHNSVGLTDDVVVDSLLADSDGTLYVGVQSNGIYQSKDAAQTWIQTPLRNQVISSGVIDAQGNIYLGINVPYNGVYKSTDGGKTWIQSRIPDSYGAPVSSLLIDSKGILYAGTDGSYLYKSSDGAKTWSPMANINTVFSFSIDSKGSIYAGTTYGIYKYDGTSLNKVWVTNQPVKSIVVDNAGNIYAGALGLGVYESTDDGLYWDPTGLRNQNVYSLAVDKTRNILYAGTDNGIYRSKDSGKTWTSVLGSKLLIQTMVVDSRGNVYAGSSDNGVFVSTNAGENWDPINPGLTNLNVLSLFTDQQNLYAGTKGSSLFKLPLSTP